MYDFEELGTMIWIEALAIWSTWPKKVDFTNAYNVILQSSEKE
jgi:hypothetical protein